MLLVEERFKDFTKKPISDAKKSTEVLLALDAESREAVDTMVKNAVKAGGSTYPIAGSWLDVWPQFCRFGRSPVGNPVHGRERNSAELKIFKKILPKIMKPKGFLFKFVQPKGYMYEEGRFSGNCRSNAQGNFEHDRPQGAECEFGCAKF